MIMKASSKVEGACFELNQVVTVEPHIEDILLDRRFVSFEALVSH